MDKITDKQMLDWLNKQDYVTIEQHYEAMVHIRTPKEIKTEGYSGNIDFFSCHSQHISNCKDLRTAIAKAMKMRKKA